MLGDPVPCINRNKAQQHLPIGYHQVLIDREWFASKERVSLNGATWREKITYDQIIKHKLQHELFEDDFNENAKVAVDIIVNSSGQVIGATVNPKGTTTTNANIRNIAIKKAKMLRLNAGNDPEQKGTIVFSFKIHE
jgi:hypothetical protein